MISVKPVSLYSKNLLASPEVKKCSTEKPLDIRFAAGKGTFVLLPALAMALFASCMSLAARSKEVGTAAKEFVENHNIKYNAENLLRQELHNIANSFTHLKTPLPKYEPLLDIDSTEKTLQAKKPVDPVKIHKNTDNNTLKNSFEDTETKQVFNNFGRWPTIPEEET